jgi:hypothetical protein
MIAPQLPPDQNIKHFKFFIDLYFGISRTILATISKRKGRISGNKIGEGCCKNAKKKKVIKRLVARLIIRLIIRLVILLMHQQVELVLARNL